MPVTFSLANAPNSGKTFAVWMRNREVDDGYRPAFRLGAVPVAFTIPKAGFWDFRLLDDRLLRTLPLNLDEGSVTSAR